MTRRGFLRQLTQGAIAASAVGEALASCTNQAAVPAASREDGRPTVKPQANSTHSKQPAEIVLPPPDLASAVSLEEALSARRSVRSFDDSMPIDLASIGQLFWAAQGVTRDWGGRTSPSAGALYPLELYAAWDSGLYHYLPTGHRAEIVLARDVRPALWEAGLHQASLAAAPAIFVVTAVQQRTAVKYGDRARRYVHVEVGHAAENLLLQAVSLGLGAVVIGAFHDAEVSAGLALPADQLPLYMIPVGHPIT